MKDSNEPQSSNPTDPFHGLSGLSLFPRTFRDFENAPNSKQPADIESIHAFMKSMALRSPIKHLEQAKAIVDGNSEFMTSEFASFLASEKRNEDAVATKVNENARERRPGLGRKRARFSLKPDSSQPSVFVEPTLDIDHIQDPEEFFLAHEKFENARTELLLMRGGSMADLNDHNKLRSERRRRPGILGKSYKLNFSSMLPKPENTINMSSQVASGQGILSPHNYSSQPETADHNGQLQEKDFTGSISETENRGDGILDEVLSDKFQNLDGDGLISFLQERLQIKRLDLDKLCLPEFHNVGKDDLMDVGQISRKPRRALSDIQNLEKGISGKTPVKHKHVVESPVTSPTPPKSPFAAISLLKKSILLSDLRIDPFSPLDLSPAKNSDSVEQSDHPVQRNKSKVPIELKSPITEIGEVVDVCAQDTCEESKNDHSGSKTDTDVRTNGPNEIGEIDIMLNTDREPRANKDSEMDENVGDTLQEAMSSVDVNCRDSSSSYTEFHTDEPHDMEMTVTQTNVEGMAQDAPPDTDIGQPSIANLDVNQNHQDQSHPSAVEPHAVDGSSETSGAIPEQHIKEPSEASMNERSPAKRPPRSKRKNVTHRQSLAGYGTSWEAGVRRSKRVKMRPLEYWKGERFLFGRIHASQPTLIGLKYLSPAKGTEAEPSIKIKSYVSDEYKELVELAALH